MPMVPMACPIPRQAAGPPESLGRPCTITATPRTKSMNRSAASRYFARNFNNMSWSVVAQSLRANLKNSDQAQGSNGRETEQQGVTGPLWNLCHAPSASPKAGTDGRNERGIQHQSPGMDEPKRNAERNLKAIDHKEKPGTRADEFKLRQRYRNEEKSHDRSRRVGHHGCDARKETHRPRKPRTVRHVFVKPRTPDAQQLQGGQADDDPANDGLECSIPQLLHEQPARKDTAGSRWKQPPDIVPSGVLAKGEDGHDVPCDQHRKHDTRGIAGSKNEGEDHHVQETDSRKAALCYANATSRNDHTKPLKRSQMRHRLTDFQRTPRATRPTKWSVFSLSLAGRKENSAPRDRVAAKG